MEMRKDEELAERLLKSETKNKSFFRHSPRRRGIQKVLKNTGSPGQAVGWRYYNFNNISQRSIYYADV